MSTLPCPIRDRLLILKYPPVKITAADAAKEASTRALQEQAPFGKSPKGVVINAAQYRMAMGRQIVAAKAIDFRWPFWVGLGAASLGFVVLLAKKS